MLVEFTSEICNTLSLEIEVVHIDIQALLVLYIEMLFCVLQQKCGLADTACALDANHTVRPVYLVHQCTADGGFRMLHQVSVCPEKSFHSCLICSNYFVKCGRITNNSPNCKVYVAKSLLNKVIFAFNQ
jgi:hypothetical protein